MFNGLLGCRAVVRPLAIRRCVPSRPHAQSWRLPLIGTKRALSSKSAGTGTLFSLDDLPVSKLDGNGGTVGPLGSPPPPRSKKAAGFNDYVTGGQLSCTDTEERAWRAAVAAGRVPNTPLSHEVWTNERRFPGSVLLTQVGNFYESYFESALEVSTLLGIKLASKRYKTGKHPFTGFPIHQLDKYLKLLVQDLGRTVVVVDEVPDPDKSEKESKDRKVARVLTPGTLLDASWLSGDESRYLLAIAIGETKLKQTKTDGEASYPVYLAYADVSTGEFFTKEATTIDIEDELARISPREIVLDTKWQEMWYSNEVLQKGEIMSDVLPLLRGHGTHISFTEPPVCSGLGVELKCRSKAKHDPSSLERSAIELLRHHLQYTLRDNMPDMPDNPEDFNREFSSTQLHIDAATLQALEVRHAMRPGGLMATAPAPNTLWSSPLSMKGTLLSVISRTMTDSGHRLLRRTLSTPSTNLADINSRLVLVSVFVDREPLRTDVRDALRSVGDVMRIIQRLRARRGDGADVWEVSAWIRSVNTVLDSIRLSTTITNRKEAASEGNDRLSELLAAFAPLNDLAEDIESAIDESKLSSVQQEGDEQEQQSDTDSEDSRSRSALSEASKKTPEQRYEELERKLQERYWMQPSFSADIEELQRTLTRLKKRRVKLQTSWRKEFGADTLLLTVNGKGIYVVTVTKKTQFGALDRAHEFLRFGETRTVKTWISEEWTKLGKELDKTYAKLDIAQDRALIRMRAMVEERASAIQRNAELVDEIDMTAGFAQVAVDRNFVRPVLDNGTELNIVNGRHPSVEAGLQSSARMFTPNTTEMLPASHLHVITGPNQGGKSTLLRQTAVITILAQAGCFVPADAAHIGIVDRVFSRIGARDDLFRDRSTFMLEMVETAGILKHATPKSLVIMDEIGRGTTLNAGMSIAYATLDYILQHIKCRTMFATHYHELGQMLGAPPHGERKSGVVSVDLTDVRPGVTFWCTDVEETEDLFSYSYRLRPGINYDSHAIKAAELAGMPNSFLQSAEHTLRDLNTQ